MIVAQKNKSRVVGPTSGRVADGEGEGEWMIGPNGHGHCRVKVL